LKVNRETLQYKLWINRLHGPHDGLFLTPKTFAVTETNGSTVAIFELRRWLKPRLQRRIEMPPGEAQYWTRGLAVAPDGRLYVGRSVWKGDNRLASVVEFTPDGAVIAEHELNLPDYPECRIFQIAPSPQGKAA
jgi:glucose/arabinose dehydrogenase